MDKTQNALPRPFFLPHNTFETCLESVGFGFILKNVQPCFSYKKLYEKRARENRSDPNKCEEHLRKYFLYIRVFDNKKYKTSKK